MTAKQRSRFWIVSTHVLTTGFAIPAITNLLVAIAISLLGLQGLISWLFLLGIMAIGYLGGTYYSLSYLQRVAVTNNWRECIKPSVITFVILNLLNFSYLIFRLKGSDVPVTLLFAVFYIAISIIFAKITSNRFITLDQKNQQI